MLRNAQAAAVDAIFLHFVQKFQI